MKSVIYVGMDVHSNSYSLACYVPQIDKFHYEETVAPDIEAVCKYASFVQELNPDAELKFGYESGCLGYSLCRKMKERNLNCDVMATTTIVKNSQSKKRKNDRRDARALAKALASNNYSKVYVLNEYDEEVRGVIRCRRDVKKSTKIIKQQISSFLLQHGYHYERSKWTNAHLAWMKSLSLSEIERYILEMYIGTLNMLLDRLEILDEKIAEFSNEPRYKSKCAALCALRGVTTLTAMTFLCEIGDFKRFSTPGQLSSYLGLTPSEYSSGGKDCKGGITKQGNCTVRLALVEASQALCKGKIGYKGKAVKTRQLGLDIAIINYADNCSVRLQKKFYRMLIKGKKRNVAITAIARELSCFMWGILTDHMTLRSVCA